MDIYYIAQEYLASEIPGATQALLVQHVRRSAIEFCLETNVYTSQINPVNLMVGAKEYNISPSVPNTVVSRPLVLYIGNTILSPVRLYDIEKAVIAFSGQGRPTAYSFLQPSTIVLYPPPDVNVTDQLKGIVAVTLSDTATMIPDWLASRYLDVITAGAKGRLMAMQNKPWTQLELAAYHRRMFSAGITNAKIEANKSFTNINLAIS